MFMEMRDQRPGLITFLGDRRVLCGEFDWPSRADSIPDCIQDRIPKLSEAVRNFADQIAAETMLQPL